jgi:hypothetical protein
VFIVCTKINAQTENRQVDSTFVDLNYLEDQIYFGLSFNLLVDTPNNFDQNGISGGITVGYIRDIPLNKERNIGLGIGLGYGYNMYNQNLKISEDGVYEIITDVDFNSNRLTTNVIEVPVEFRWRTSTPTKYSFWRIYGGIKFGYVFSSTSKYSDDFEQINVSNIEELRNFQYGLNVSAGYSTFNLSLYYGLNTLFENAFVNGEPIDMKQLNIGMIFYIL